MEGRSGRVSSSSIWGFVEDEEDLEGKSEGSTSLPGIGDPRRGLPVAPSIKIFKVDLAEVHKVSMIKLRFTGSESLVVLT